MSKVPDIIVRAILKDVADCVNSHSIDVSATVHSTDTLVLDCGAVHLALKIERKES